jgi:hypothetical protein
LAYCLVVEGCDDVVGALLALEDNLGDHDRVLLHQPAARDDAAHRGHGALDVGGCCAGGEVLRHHHERTGQAPDCYAPVEGVLRRQHGFGCCWCCAAVGKRWRLLLFLLVLVLVRLPRRLQL